MHTHIPIWGEIIPGNTGKSKDAALTPWHPDWTAFEALETLFQPEKRLSDMSGANTVTRLVQIPSGHVSENFDDVPYIVPFLAGSRECVLICPGGAYYDVSMDNEGYPTAEFLQKQGISAFVLKYRTWPYKYPTAYLDCRRALCYIKFHAQEFGIDPEKVSLMGFSAGGNLVAATTFLFGNYPQIDGYEQDATDKVDPTPASLAPIYPELLADRFLLSMQFGERIFTDESFYEEIKRRMYIPSLVKQDSVPAFLCCCLDDGVVPPENVLTMANAYYRAGASVEVHIFREGGHGFGVRQEDIPPMYGNPAFRMDGTRDWIRLYISWMHKTVG